MQTERETASDARPGVEMPAHVLSRQVDGQMVLLNLETEQYYGLDEVGATIVSRLTELPYDEAFASLVADYEVDATVLRRDIDDLVGELVEAGLLARVDGAG